MEEKTYIIDNVKFRLKIDFTLDETDQLQEIFSKLYTPDRKTIAGNFTSKEIKTFLELVLEPQDKIHEGFSFGKAKESVQLEVFKDFFLNRIGRAGDLTSSFAPSTLLQ
jgi:hypothetical protein